MSSMSQASLKHDQSHGAKPIVEAVELPWSWAVFERLKNSWSWILILTLKVSLGSAAAFAFWAFWF